MYKNFECDFKMVILEEKKMDYFLKNGRQYRISS